MRNPQWMPLSSHADYEVLMDTRVRGWVVKIDGKWVARDETATIRAEFTTIDEAKDFLKTMLGATE
jgi:hypothetical protein